MYIIGYEIFDLTLSYRSEPSNPGDNNKYNEGDIVLGKIKGYPPWPGKVSLIIRRNIRQ